MMISLLWISNLLILVCHCKLFPSLIFRDGNKENMNDFENLSRDGTFGMASFLLNLKAEIIEEESIVKPAPKKRVRATNRKRKAAVIDEATELSSEQQKNQLRDPSDIMGKVFIINYLSKESFLAVSRLEISNQSLKNASFAQLLEKSMMCYSGSIQRLFTHHNHALSAKIIMKRFKNCDGDMDNAMSFAQESKLFTLI
jgi:hypothetical protein